MFFRNIGIQSMKQAAEFRNLVMGAGNERLTPFVDLVEWVDVEHYLDEDGRSFFHILGALTPRLHPSKFREFYVEGPARKLHANVRLRSPLWASADV